MIGRIGRIERRHPNEPGWIVIHGHITTAKTRHHREVRVVGTFPRTSHRTEFTAPAVFEA